MNDYTKTCWTHNAIVERQNLQNLKLSETVAKLCEIDDKLKTIAQDCFVYDRIDYESARFEYRRLNTERTRLRGEMNEIREDLNAISKALKPIGDK